MWSKWLGWFRAGSHCELPTSTEHRHFSVGTGRLFGPVVPLDNIIISLCKQFTKIHCCKASRTAEQLGARAGFVLLLTWQSSLAVGLWLPAGRGEAALEVGSRQENWLKFSLLHFLTKKIIIKKKDIKRSRMMQTIFALNSLSIFQNIPPYTCKPAQWCGCSVNN